ncbi:MAG: GFA family protein [Rhizobiales bacterium]|nr:GFA family protein [Hyphomicrobiales bacterium]
MAGTGGCRCGAVRFRYQGQPVATRLCWCRDCQYWASGNATMNIIVPQAGLAIEGAPAHYDSSADSGHHMRRSFCAACGTQLLSQSLENTEFIVVRVGALDHAEGIRPEAVIWTSSAPEWALFDPALPRFPKGAT